MILNDENTHTYKKNYNNIKHSLNFWHRKHLMRRKYTILCYSNGMGRKKNLWYLSSDEILKNISAKKKNDIFLLMRLNIHMILNSTGFWWTLKSARLWNLFLIFLKNDVFSVDRFENENCSIETNDLISDKEKTHRKTVPFYKTSGF